jgi:hypothetical protein
MRTLFLVLVAIILPVILCGPPVCNSVTARAEEAAISLNAQILSTNPPQIIIYEEFNGHEGPLTMAELRKVQKEYKNQVHKHINPKCQICYMDCFLKVSRRKIFKNCKKRFYAYSCLKAADKEYKDLFQCKAPAEMTTYEVDAAMHICKDIGQCQWTKKKYQKWNKQYLYKLFAGEKKVFSFWKKDGKKKSNKIDLTKKNKNNPRYQKKNGKYVKVSTTASPNSVAKYKNMDVKKKDKSKESASDLAKDANNVVHVEKNNLNDKSDKDKKHNH